MTDQNNLTRIDHRNNRQRIRALAVTKRRKAHLLRHHVQQPALHHEPAQPHRCDLKEQGYVIHTAMITMKTQSGRQARVAQYSM